MKTSTTSKNTNLLQAISLEIDVKISEVTLTPIACASLVNEILKGLLYQKCQIPYPYSWMKNMVDKKRTKTEPDGKNKPVNFTATSHFRIVSKAYDALETAMKGILKEFSNHDNCIKEIVVLFGTTPQCPKEVVTINVLHLDTQHNERNHIAELDKYQQKILRHIFLSQIWLDNINASVNCTNTYIYLKKQVPIQTEDGISSNCNDSIFVRSRPLVLPVNLKHIKINLFPDYSTVKNCCQSLLVFGDTRDINIDELRTNEVKTEGNFVWYQYKDAVQGFKDCFINKISASELW